MDRRADDSSDSTKPVVNEAPFLIQTVWCLTAFPFIFLALRLYCKAWRRRSLWWDDYVLILSWVSLLSSTVILTVGTKYGIGLHYSDMEPELMPIQGFLSYAAGFSAILASTWSKTSFALSLSRITEGKMRAFVWFIIVTVNIVLGVSATILWISCWPVQKLWGPEVPGSCWERSVGETYQTFASSYSGLMDIVLALLPWKIVWKAKIYRTEKIGALLAMSVGIFSGVITFCKILVLPEISDDDSTTVNLKIFGTAEPAAAIIACSIPVLRALIRRKRGHSLGQPLLQMPSDTQPSFPSPIFRKTSVTTSNTYSGTSHTYSQSSHNSRQSYPKSFSHTYCQSCSQPYSDDVASPRSDLTSPRFELPSPRDGQPTSPRDGIVFPRYFPGASQEHH